MKLIKTHGLMMISFCLQYETNKQTNKQQNKVVFIHTLIGLNCNIVNAIISGSFDIFTVYRVISGGQYFLGIRVWKTKHEIFTPEKRDLVYTTPNY